MTLHSSDAHMQYPLNNSQKYCKPCTQNYQILSLRTHEIFTFEIWQQVTPFASNTFEQRKHVGSQNRVKIFVFKKKESFTTEKNKVTKYALIGVHLSRGSGSWKESFIWIDFG